MLFQNSAALHSINAAEQAKDTLHQRAASGDVSAQLQLGKEYFNGRNRTQNRALSLYYFKLAAEAGSPEGMFNLGMCYEYGVEFESDKLNAFFWYDKAGDFAPALFKKAVFLESGIPPHKTSRTYRKGVRANPQKSKIILNDLIIPLSQGALPFLLSGNGSPRAQPRAAAKFDGSLHISSYQGQMA